MKHLEVMVGYSASMDLQAQMQCVAVPWCWAKTLGEMEVAKSAGNVSAPQNSGQCTTCQWTCEPIGNPLVHFFLKASSTGPASWAFLDWYPMAKKAVWDIAGLWYFCLLEIWNIFYLSINVVIAGRGCTGPLRDLHCPTWSACTNIHHLWVLINSEVPFSLHFSLTFYKRNVCSFCALCRLQYL